jgi:hypothetical protein
MGYIDTPTEVLLELEYMKNRVDGRAQWKLQTISNLTIFLLNLERPIIMMIEFFIMLARN